MYQKRLLSKDIQWLLFYSWHEGIDRVNVIKFTLSINKKT